MINLVSLKCAAAFQLRNTTVTEQFELNTHARQKKIGYMIKLKSNLKAGGSMAFI